MKNKYYSHFIKFIFTVHGLITRDQLIGGLGDKESLVNQSNKDVLNTFLATLLFRSLWGV